MANNHNSPPSTIVDATFHSMEEMNELSRAMGREGEFRQLSKGRVTSRWRWQQLGELSLSSHRVDKSIYGRLCPPKGHVAMAVMPPPHRMLVDGHEFGSDQVLVIDANSQLDFVNREEAVCYTLTVPESVFVASGRALFPPMRTNGGLTRIWQCPSSGWSALHGVVTSLLRNPSVVPEYLPHLLSRFLHLMEEEPDRRQREVCPGTRGTGAVARRAQGYIEDHYPYMIRMEDVCRWTGVSMRTVQRCFSEYFQLSPFAYLKARRLNAARQALVVGDPSRDSVTQIGLESGFQHLGRFAVEYREYFGELPKETLRRGARS